ncbi:phenylacetic acid degradation operon negative regulatory protein PaaX [Camelliibacillus cellulosilyticus]|uniref:Phenylacetic acid degradation operon negative regulatory protein PaaX n=1 Tax=Camelliibacillus cellulosilyticus TaxID=2174486 RepID=A0ABV9GMC5_9BACL
MRNHLNTRSMIFTLYGDYIRHYGNEIWIGSLIRLMEAFGHNEQSVRAAMSRMNKQGWVASRKEGNKSYYRLTDRGVKRMDEAAHRIFKLQPDAWDGKWRLFTYTIPEERRQVRDELRQELIWSGFGQLAGGLWITPNDLHDQVNDIIDKYGIRESVSFFISENAGPKENKRLVSECWDIDTINERYDAFIKLYSEKYILDKNKIEKGLMNDQSCFARRTNLVHEYRKFLFVDPGLPLELLPEKWLGDTAAALFSEYYRVLAEPASRFFESVFFLGNEKAKKSAAYNIFNHPLMVDSKVDEELPHS